MFTGKTQQVGRLTPGPYDDDNPSPVILLETKEVVGAHNTALSTIRYLGDQRDRASLLLRKLFNEGGRHLTVENGIVTYEQESGTRVIVAVLSEEDELDLRYFLHRVIQPKDV